MAHGLSTAHGCNFVVVQALTSMPVVDGHNLDKSWVHLTTGEYLALRTVPNFTLSSSWSTLLQCDLGYVSCCAYCALYVVNGLQKRHVCFLSMSYGGVVVSPCSCTLVF